MLLTKKTSTDDYLPSAKIIDGTLILTLPNAVSPVVWQMELGQSKSSALEVRANDNNQFTLVLKTPRQDVQDIATFANKEAAVEALLVTSKAMEAGSGQLHPNARSHYPLPVVTHQNSNGFSFFLFFKKLLKFIGWVILTLVILMTLIFIASKLISATGTGSSSIGTNGPISADEFLESQ